MTRPPAWQTALFLFTQIAPPILMFAYVFGHFGIGVAFIVMPALLYSTFRVFSLLRRRHFHRLIRPTLTICGAAVIIGMGNYYASQSAQTVNALARAMQAQCKQQRVCVVPPGAWQAQGNRTFAMQTAGWVPMHILLVFDEDDAPSPPCKDCTRAGNTANRFSRFHLIRVLEDHDYDAYGGVDQALRFPN